MYKFSTIKFFSYTYCIYFQNDLFLYLLNIPPLSITQNQIIPNQNNLVQFQHSVHITKIALYLLYFLNLFPPIFKIYLIRSRDSKWYYIEYILLFLVHLLFVFPKTLWLMYPTQHQRPLFNFSVFFSTCFQNHLTKAQSHELTVATKSKFQSSSYNRPQGLLGTTSGSSMGSNRIPQGILWAIEDIKISLGQ